DGTCRRVMRSDAEKRIAAGENASVRFRMPDKKIVVSDLIRGDVEFDKGVIGDFIIVRPDGSATFHLAVCVDDGLMKITHVVRGEDHFSNTPKHIAIFEACDFEVPTFAHMPLTMGPGGEPLSKRLGAMSLGEYKKMGYLPHALANYMALLGWSPGNDEELFSFDDLQEKFTLERVSKS
ncbi:MAG: glutamate--tRNA ligase, partial [Moraxella sp.]|nr:glutamate--tRNA ligase [Moraxella sp.]